jgi:hypothetical protein
MVFLVTKQHPQGVWGSIAKQSGVKQALTNNWDSLSYKQRLLMTFLKYYNGYN